MFERFFPRTASWKTCGFGVDDVSIATSPLGTEPLSHHVASRFRRKILLLPQSERPMVNLYCQIALDQETMRVSNPVSRIHPLIDAVHLAFSPHRPLTLSPDSIWLTISQGFSHHTAENADALRYRLVHHAGKADLIQTINSFNIEEFASAIDGFSAQIRAASDPILHETLICDFSTTTAEIRTASEVVLMDAYASYFTYIIHCICGIPRVTLTGTAEDWRRIRARVEVLATFDLEWWVERLRPILDEFIATAEGRPDLTFWKAIYKPRATYGTEVITGWIADLFPYLGTPSVHPENPSCRGRNHILGYKRIGWLMPEGEGISTGLLNPGARFGVRSKSFPSGLASVPLNLTFHNASQTKKFGPSGWIFGCRARWRAFSCPGHRLGRRRGCARTAHRSRVGMAKLLKLGLKDLISIEFNGDVAICSSAR